MKYARALSLLPIAALLPASLSAQSIKDRARAAAEAARAKSGDSEAIQKNYITPGLSGQPIATVDASKSFTPNLACQKTASLLEILIQPGGTGDITTVRIARDKDLDGSFDSLSNLPVPVSGICANGILSCAPGSWNECRSFQWDVDTAGDLKLAEVAMPELAGCYCINNSCGANLVMGNLPSVLKDLGGGAIGALTTHDPRIGVAEARVNGPLIQYVGAQSTACSASPSLPQTAYRGNPTAILSDAASTAATNSLFQSLKGSPTAIGKAEQVRACTIEREVTLRPLGYDDIVSASGVIQSVKGWVPVLFVSSSMPTATLRTYAAQLEKTRGVMAFRGMPGGMTKVAPMAKLTAETLRLDPGCEGPACAMRDVQVIVDPLVFRQHGVTRVPALAMIPGDPALPYCEREDESPRAAHVVYGDAALSGLLEEIARLGGKEEVRDAQSRLEGR